MQENNISRRLFLKKVGGLSIALGLNPAIVNALPTSAIKRTIHSSGELLPVIGMGSSRTFDVDDDQAARAIRVKVLQTFFNRGGGMIDSSPMYRSSEEVISYCLDHVKNKQSIFSATKVWIVGKGLGINQMVNSETLWGITRFDLMQIHNMVDWRTHLETLRIWKEERRLRYIGITTSHGRRHNNLEKALTSEVFDFVQFSYNIMDREVEERLLPIAKDNGIAVIINRPFQRGKLFNYVKGKPLPVWANEFDCTSWAQFFLKFIVSHPVVTCVIPATARVDHMQENMGAGFGHLPDARTRVYMMKHFESLV